MTLIFDSKIACHTEIDQRLAMLADAIKALQEQKLPRMRAILDTRDKALADFDAANPGAPDHPERQTIIDQFDDQLLPLATQALASRRPLDRLIEFYTDRDVDTDNPTIQ